MLEHRYTDTVHASDAELSGERVRYAGGNDAMFSMRGWGAPAMVGPTPVPQIGSSVPANGAGAASRLGGATIANSAGGQVSLGKVQVTTAVLFAGAILALVAMHKLGFKFSATVG